jgi:pimeloyl-CoA dehydrogenase large subunit
MDLRFSPEENAFRQEVRTFFQNEIPLEIRSKLMEGRGLSKADMVTSQKTLHKKGWAVYNWPKEWGGRDWTPVQQYIFLEEMQLNGVPPPVAFNTSMNGPVIIQFGTEAQKKKFLPRMASLDDWWCQGFSEPGAGSDLASLKTTAVRQGDHYIVNGQKTWTTLAQHADWIFCLVRTDPTAKKQLGISYIVFPMTSPGVTRRPIQLIDGGHEVNEVFFDDVKVPVENLIGEENRGWDCAKFLLGNERFGIARVGASKMRVARIKQLAKMVPSDRGSLMDDPQFAEKVAAAEVELKALEMTQMRFIAAERNNTSGKPNPATSMLKLKGSEIQQTVTELLMEVAGPLAMPFANDEDDEMIGHNAPPVGAEWAAPAAPTYFNYRKVSIYGGSNEIQRNILAKAVLGF